MNPAELLWQGALFSGAALVALLVMVYWAFLSPLKVPVEPRPVSPRLAGWLTGLLAYATMTFFAGGLWDASMHRRTGQIPAGADFLWPPHLLLYSGFLISIGIAGFGLGTILKQGWAKGQRDPRIAFRRAPALGIVVLAAVYELLTIPGDAIWHALFGPDLTAWSPPHLLLALAVCAVPVCATSLLVGARPSMRRPWLVDGTILLMLALALNAMALLGYIEWENGGSLGHWVAQRPIWYYPAVTGGTALLALGLARALVRGRWSATLTTLLFFGVRIGLTTILAGIGEVVPQWPLNFVLGALLLDLAGWAVGRSGLRGLPSGLLQVVAFTAGFALLSFPTWLARFPQGEPYLWTAAVATGVLGLIALGFTAWAGRRLATY